MYSRQNKHGIWRCKLCSLYEAFGWSIWVACNDAILFPVNYESFGPHLHRGEEACAIPARPSYSLVPTERLHIPWAPNVLQEKRHEGINDKRFVPAHVYPSLLPACHSKQLGTQTPRTHNMATVHGAEHINNSFWKTYRVTWQYLLLSGLFCSWLGTLKHTKHMLCERGVHVTNCFDIDWALRYHQGQERAEGIVRDQKNDSDVVFLQHTHPVIIFKLSTTLSEVEFRVNVVCHPRTQS